MGDSRRVDLDTAFLKAQGVLLYSDFEVECLKIAEWAAKNDVDCSWRMHKVYHSHSYLVEHRFTVFVEAVWA